MSQPGSSGIHVLLVDDEPDFARLVADQLAASEGDLSVTAETDARSAVERLDEEPFDCVVSDYEMPAMDGLELLEAVRERYPDLPFVLFTGQGSEDVASEAISAGVTEYMRKATHPQQFEVLANRVRNAVEKYRAERELARTETRYRRLVEQNLTGIYIIQDGVIRYANPKAAEIFGYDQGEIDGMSVYEVVAEADHGKLERSIRERVAGDAEEMNYTLTGVRKSGERFEFDVHSGVVDYGGDPALLGTLIDVTEQRERERELEEYRELVETVGDPMYVLDADGDIEKANRAMAELLGYSREELRGTPGGDNLRPDDAERAQVVVEGMAAGDLESPQTQELTFVTADGEAIPVEANISVLTDEHGAFRGSVGVVRVIADRKERERELEEYETIVETAPDGVFIIDEEGIVVSGNEPGASMVGYDRDELLGEHYTTLVEDGVVDASFAERYVETVEELLSRDAGTRKAKLETTLHRADGSVTTEIHIAPLVGDDGSFRGTVGILRDITERKAIEDELRAERDRLSALFENIPEPAIDYEFRDGEPVVLQANDAFESVFGYDEATVRGESVDEYIIPDSYDDEASGLNERVVAGEQLDVEIERETAGGETRNFLLRNAPIPTEDDTIQGYAIYTDITERKRTEERINALFEFSTDCIVETEYVDGEPVVERANDAFVETFGYEEDELVGESLDEFIVPEGKQAEAAAVNDRVTGGEPVEMEVTRRTASGLRDFLMRSIPFDLYDGEWTYAVYTDITDRKERERRLSALHEATRRLMEATSREEVMGIGLDAAETVLGLEVAAFYEAERDGEQLRPLAATEGARDLFDDVPVIDGAAIAREVYESGGPVIADNVREHPRVYDPGTPVRSEMVLPLGDHGVFLAASEEEAAFDEADATLAKVLVSNVEAALDRAERESLLRERERRLSALHEATRRLMEATSREDVVDIGLGAAESVLGLDVAAVYGLDDERLEPLAATEGAHDLFDGLPSFAPGEGILWHVLQSGDPVVTDDFREQGVIYDPTTPVRSEMVLPLGDHGVFMAASGEVAAFDEADATLAKVLVSNVEAALDRAERETLLREREQALLRQNERLEQFAGVVSHDLRSPLTVAKGNTYLLREKGDEAYIDRIEDALERMEQLIDDLLSLARQGETVDESERTNLVSVADDAWAAVDTGAASLAVADVAVEADPGRFQQLLENLFRNAVEHGGRSVDVTVGADDDRLYVEDDGPGIPDVEREQLFEAGFSTDDEGTGFGLSIVKQIATAHGWEVVVTDGEDGGARFEFHGVELSEPVSAD